VWSCVGLRRLGAVVSFSSSSCSFAETLLNVVTAFYGED